MFNFSSQLTPSGDWRKDRERLRLTRQELAEARQLAPALSTYLQRKFDQAQDQLIPHIEHGAAVELGAAITRYQEAGKKMTAAAMKEIVGWNIPALQAERGAIEAMVKDIGAKNSPFETRDKLEQLTGLFQELTIEAQPAVRRRAAVEIFGNITEMGLRGSLRDGSELAHHLGGLAVTARKLEPALRVSPEMLSADGELQAAGGELANLHTELENIGKELDITGVFHAGPLNKMLARVGWNERSRALEVYEENSPQVINRIGGVVFNEKKLAPEV